MQIHRTSRDDVIVLAVDGRLDATTAPPFESALTAELHAGATRLVVDLDQVQLISSAALRVLVSAAKQMKKQGGRIVLCALTPEVAKVFGISGLASLFDLQPTQAAALASLGITDSATAEPPPVPAAPLEQTPPHEEVPLPAFEEPAKPEVVPASFRRQAEPPAEPSMLEATPGEVASPEPLPEPAPPVLPVDVPSPARAPAFTRMVPPAAPATMPPPTERTPPPAPVWLQPSSSSSAPPRPPETPTGRAGTPLATIIGGAAGALLWWLGLIALTFHHGSGPRDTTQATFQPPAETPAPTVNEATPAVTENPTPIPSETAAVSPPATASQTPAETPGNVATTVSVSPDEAGRFNANTPENQETRKVVLQRIDAMQLAPAQRDQLHQAVDRARGMGKMITIRFGVGRTDLTGSAVEDLKAALRQPGIQKLINDPTAVFVVLGFADANGAAQANKDLSQRRADRTLAALRDQCGMLNVMHAFGMGGSVLLDKQHLEKNRVAEVWVVQP